MMTAIVALVFVGLALTFGRFVYDEVLDGRYYSAFVIGLLLTAALLIAWQVAAYFVTGFDWVPVAPTEGKGASCPC